MGRTSCVYEPSHLHGGGTALVIDLVYLCNRELGILFLAKLLALL